MSKTNDTHLSSFSLVQSGVRMSPLYGAFNRPRDYDLREHIPVPYDNLFQSILSFA